MKATPMVCLVCKHTPGAYYGRLVFPEELAPGQPEPQCPNHEGKDLEYPLTPVDVATS